MRVRVRININQPLKRCIRLDILGDGVESIILLRYERLPNHCFKCGMVDHNTNECLSLEQCLVFNGVESLQFGIWLRASTPFSRYKNRDRVVASTGKKQVDPSMSGDGWRKQQDQNFYANDVVVNS